MFLEHNWKSFALIGFTIHVGIMYELNLNQSPKKTKTNFVSLMSENNSNKKGASNEITI